MRFLLFTLYAPLGAFGEVAVGERRMGWARPGRSAILGLLAAAQGIDRADEAAHRELETGLHLAIRTDAPGRPFIDYHTAQTPKARKGRSYATRRAELSAPDLHTILSTREWRADACFSIALWLRPGSNIDLDSIAETLRRPNFVMYAGRKSAPLGLPLNAAVVEAGNFIEAFEARQPNNLEREVLDSIGIGDTEVGAIAFDHDAEVPPIQARVERRRDSVVSRTRWQFADRLERVVEPRGRED